MAKRSAPRTNSKKPAPARKVVAEVIEQDETSREPEEVLEDELRSRGGQDSDDSDETFESPASPALPVPSSERGLASADPLVLYLNELRKYPLLSREQELEVAKRYYETKDPEAAQLLVKSNLRFVVKVAAEYSKFGARLIDLIQEGNVGLMHAVREFNPTKGARLITYAVWWIRGYIQEYLMRQYSLVRIGTTQTQRKLFYQLQKQKEALEALGDHPDYAALSEKLGVSEEDVASMAQRLSGRDVSLDRPLDEGSTSTLADLQTNSADVPLDEQLAREEQLAMLREQLADLRSELNEREKILLEERILADDPLTLQEIGEKYGITREAVRQAEARLMKKIKDRMEDAQKSGSE